MSDRADLLIHGGDVDEAGALVRDGALAVRDGETAALARTGTSVAHCRCRT